MLGYKGCRREEERLMECASILIFGYSVRETSMGNRWISVVTYDEFGQRVVSSIVTAKESKIYCPKEFWLGYRSFLQGGWDGD